MNHNIVAIVVAFGSILFFHTLVSPQELMGVKTTSNQFHLQNQITKEQEQKNNFENQAEDSNKILGIVNNGTFFSLDAKSPKILTSVMMQEARNPEAGIIDLHQYE